MNKELVQSYSARITQANRSELVVIIYEVIISDIDHAIMNYGQGNVVEFNQDLKHSQKFMNELISTLDFHHVLSYDLLQLYLYVNKRIITAMIKKTPDTLESARKVMNSLLVGFEGVSKKDSSEPLMQNTQQLYTGLTYGKGLLNETYIDPKQNLRGFKA